MKTQQNNAGLSAIRNAKQVKVLSRKQSRDVKGAWGCIQPEPGCVRRFPCLWICP
jgi:hypothetical protein